MSKKNEDNLKKLLDTIESFLQVARTKSMDEKPVMTRETDLYEDLEIDSLEAMDLMAEIERVFNISVEPKEMMSKSKIGDLVDYISSVQSK